jgi:predicted GIY-YIG superfamily endonuclease
MPAKKAARARWWVYVLRCADGTLYAGSTNDLERRVSAHNAGTGAKYTRSRGPVALAWHERAPSRSAALRREAAIKRLTRQEKLRLVACPTSSPRKSAAR